jgi:hypothetical protein
MIWNPANTTMNAVADSFGPQIRAKFASTSGYPDLATYINSAHGDETLEQRYGARKLPRLAALKKIWDPNGVFVYNNAIPTHYP